MPISARLVCKSLIHYLLMDFQIQEEPYILLLWSKWSLLKFYAVTLNSSKTMLSLGLVQDKEDIYLFPT